MTAPARTRSRSRSTTRRPVRHTSGGPDTRVVFAIVLGVALLVGAVVGYFLLKPSRTAASSSIAPMAPASEVALGGEANPGPLRLANGVPSGFEPGTPGAIAASSAYTQALIQLSARPASDVRPAAEVMASKSAVDNVVAGVATLRTQLSSESGTSLRVVPLGSKVTVASKNQASIDVWAMTLIAKPTGVNTAAGVIPAPTEAVYTTVTLELVRANNDWKLAGVRSVEGPTPAVSAVAPTDAERFASDLASYAPFVYAPPSESK